MREPMCRRPSVSAFIGTILPLGVLLLSGCVTPMPAPVAESPGAPPSSRAQGAQLTGETPMIEESNPSLEAIIEGAIAEGWRDLYLEVFCSNYQGELQQMEIFTSGVGIWNRSRQFRLSDDEIRETLRTLNDGGFARLAGLYGKGGASSDVPDRQSPAIGCSILLRLDGAQHASAQRTIGFQSERLRTLALTTLALHASAGKAGIAVDDLSDGLAQLANGTLAPETFSLVLHRKPAPQALDQGVPGWLLRVQPQEISTRRLDRESGYGPVFELDDARLAHDVAAWLVEAEAAGLPTNLWSEHYTDLSIETLQHRKRIQARAFAGMERATHGEAQERFERLLDRLQALHQRLLADGTGQDHVD